MPINVNKLALQVAEKVRERATIQGRIPFLSGDLRKSIQVELTGKGTASVGSNLSYARAIHDGRPKITFGPKNKKFLRFKWKGRVWFKKSVTQKARKGKPFLSEGIDDVEKEGFDFLIPEISKQIEGDLTGGILKDIKINIG